jgi:hypothetical protein
MGYARYPLTYGLISGAVIAAAIAVGLAARHQLGFTATQWFGYLVMLVALTFIFVGVKRYRDVEKGGVIRFLPAFGMGLTIALVAALAYAAVWETYLAATDYSFMEEYIAEETRRLQASGVSAAELAKKTAEFEWGRQVYSNFFTRFGITMAEILPVGLLVALVSAVALMFPKVFPAR